MRTRLTSFVLLIGVTASASLLAQVTGARDRARVPYRVGLENMKAEAWDKAVESFKTAIDIDPTFEMAYYMLGRTHMAQKRFAEAVPAYEKCRTLYQQQGGRQFSNVHERQRFREDRIRDIDEAIRLYQAGPQTAGSVDAVRQLQNQRREIQDAIARSNANLTLNLSTVPAYVSTALGSAYFRSGNLPAAEKEYKAAIEADGRAGEAYSNLAVVYMETGRLDDAEKSVKDAEKIGFKVNPQLKDEIKNRRKAGTN